MDAHELERAVLGTDRGATLLELMLMVALGITLVGMAVPAVLGGLDAGRARVAAAYMASQLRLAHMEAVKRSRAVALRFEGADTGYRFTRYIDGNGNGVRTVDIKSGVDRILGAPERLQDNFPGVTFGVLAGVTSIDADRAISDGDPIRIGSADLLTFTPIGTATPGTLYLRGRGAHQYAVRVLGVTARTRVLEFNFGETRWLTH
jgi:hypothetical protein